MNESTTPQVAGEAQIPWALLAGVMATVAIFAVAQGLTYPLLSFILERQGASAGLIGLSAAMTPLGLIAGSTLIPGLIRRLGSGFLGLGCAITAGTTLALIGWTQDVVAWFPLRFTIGLAIGPLFVLSETWLIALSPARRRGRILGIYTAVVSAGFAAGPLSLMAVGTEGWPPFLIGVGAFALCTCWLAAIRRRLPDLGREDEHASVRDVVGLAPALLLAVVTTAAFEQGLLSLLPVYGSSYGIGERNLSALLTMIPTSSVFFRRSKCLWWNCTWSRIATLRRRHECVLYSIFSINPSQITRDETQELRRLGTSANGTTRTSDARCPRSAQCSKAVMPSSVRHV